jgi:serine/threonine protein kinase
MLQIARGLKDAHNQGVCHLDLKPSNVLISYRGEVKLTDFEFSRSLSGELSLSLATQDGIAGTLPYMSPEQRRGQKADAKSDIYTFGVMLFEALVGELPQPGDTPVDFTGDKTFDHIFAKSFARPRKRFYSGRYLLDELLKLKFGRQDTLRLNLIRFLERKGLDNKPQRFTGSNNDSDVFPIQKDLLPQKVVLCRLKIEQSSYFMFFQGAKSYHPFHEFHLRGYRIDCRQKEEKIITDLAPLIGKTCQANGVGTYIAKVISGSGEELFVSPQFEVTLQNSTHPRDVARREEERLRQEALFVKQETDRIRKENWKRKLQKDRENRLQLEAEREERRREYIERYGEDPAQAIAGLMLLAPMLIPVAIVAISYLCGGM